MTHEYNKDFCLWLKEQASHIRNKKFAKLDIDNLAEEVESIVSKERNSISDYLKTIILDRLRASNNTRPYGCIYEDRLFHANYLFCAILRNSPSLKKDLPQALYYAYAIARLQFLDENNMDESAISETCPWNIQELIEDVESNSSL